MAFLRQNPSDVRMAAGDNARDWGLGSATTCDASVIA
jgi:hypothetical protein